MPNYSGKISFCPVEGGIRYIDAMPFAFQLPTTAAAAFSTYISSTTHPSLPQTATVHRNLLRNTLKRHKRLSPQSRSSDLSTVLSALNEYLPYLLAIDSGLAGQAIHDEQIDVSLRREVELEWRSTISSTVPGREPPRIKGKGLDFEVDFVLSTLAYVHTLLARSQLLTLYASTTPTVEQRTQVIQTATRHLLDANAIHAYISSRVLETDASSAVVETLSQTHRALASLAMAESTLLAVLKDDPYPFVVAQSRNQNDKDWMIKPPEIPKVRAHLFARLCLAAAEHAGMAQAGLSASGRVSEDLLDYARDLRRAARAKACRFFGIDAELEGETGKAIAWLAGGRNELGFASHRNDEQPSKLAGLKKFKKDWTEKREDKKVEKGSDWGSDAGRFEELRVNEHLEAKWTKMNDTVCMSPSNLVHLRSDNLADQHPIDSTIGSACGEYAVG